MIQIRTLDVQMQLLQMFLAMFDEMLMQCGWIIKHNFAAFPQTVQHYLAIFDLLLISFVRLNNI
jgi:hypothetical protein